MKPFGEDAGHGFTSHQTGDENGEEEVPVYECMEGCPVKALDEQSGNRPSTGNHPSSAVGESNYRPGQGAYQKQGQLYSDSGGASRFFAQFEPDAPVINRFEDGMKPFGEGAGHGFTSHQTGDENGEEEVPVYECMEGCPVKALDEQSGTLKSGKDVNPTKGEVSGFFGSKMSHYSSGANYGDSGGASRFFAQFEPDAPFIYCSKASTAEKRIDKDIEQHPTVKPVTLMSYLVRLVTPKGGVVLDPYSGSGTTCVAAVLEDVNFVGIEKHEPYVERGRIRVEMARRGEFSKSAKKTETKKKKAKAVGPETLKAVEPEISLLDLALNGDEQISG
jgi:ferredoxin